MLWTLPSSPVLGADHRIRFCGFGGSQELLVGLKSYWRNLEFCRAYDEGKVAEMRALADIAEQLGVVYSLHGCTPAVSRPYKDEHDCWAVDFLGRRPFELGVGYPCMDYCHPATIAAMKDDLDVALDQAQASSFMIVDYVWPYVGGRWGYSQWDIAAYREALNGTDGGLTVVDSHGEKNLGFWEYFEELSGLRLAPHEVGCESWDEYVPVRAPDVETNPTDENRRSFFLFYGLYHYCWLRFAQECGQYAQSLGGELQASLNPENFANGTDILTWGRLKNTGEPWLEEWASAWIAIAGYHNLWYFARPYRQAGKRLGLIGETCAGGGGHPPLGGNPGYAHYWAPQANYAITYALGASGQFDDREEDYIWTSWAEMSDPSGPHWDCWRGYKAAMDGFWQYALDGPRRPQCEVLSVVNRSVLHHAGSSEYETKLDYT
ncbi:MAG: hypothetical protein KAW89_00605, partial [Armatimonadetes bacterium]|nr:hypothetical protein [Armatimonadota bacterium]